MDFILQSQDYHFDCSNGWNVHLRILAHDYPLAKRGRHWTVHKPEDHSASYNVATKDEVEMFEEMFDRFK